MRFLVTAGPTREFIDPVRFLSNPSTGKMGFAVAAAAVAKGHSVTLVAGPVALETPKGVNRIDVVSARDMLDAVRKKLSETDVLVMTAAVADWRPARVAAKKMKKAEMKPIFRLVSNPDILKTLKRFKDKRVFIGFAAETGDPLKEALRKCRAKGLDLVVANDVASSGSGFGTSTDKVTFVFPDGKMKSFPLMAKRKVGGEIVKAAMEIEKARSDNAGASSGGQKR